LKTGWRKRQYRVKIYLWKRKKNKAHSMNCPINKKDLLDSYDQMY